jgi:hypothetical protein
MELMGELRGFPVAFLPLGLVQGVLVSVNQQHISHAVASILAQLILPACPRNPAAGEAYFLYVEPAVEGANEADGPLSSL